MKTVTKLISGILFFALTGMMLTGCDKDETLKPDEARNELDKAYAEVMGNMQLMMETPAMESIMFLSELSGMDLDIVLKSDIAPMVQTPHATGKNLQSFAKSLAPEINTKQDPDDFDNGIYHYNFDEGDFDLVDPDVDYIEVHFPANQGAYNNQLLNGILRIDELEFEEVYDDEWDEWEIMPTKLSMWLKIDDVEVMSLDFNMDIGSSGIPMAVSLDMQMHTYVLSASYSGSNLDFNAKVSFREGGTTLMSADIDVKLRPGKDDIERLSGQIQLMPIKFKGHVNVYAMDQCDENISCMNNNIDIEVSNAENNKIIGHLEFRMYYDEYWDEEYAELVIVYSDGSYDFLFEIFGFEDFDI